MGTSTREILRRSATRLIPLRTPSVDVALPTCAQNCLDYLQAALACSPTTITMLESCYCHSLTFPTACASFCPIETDRSSVASWYWHLCPSAMDSRLGSIGVGQLVSRTIFSVPSWAVQTAGSAQAAFTGYRCYASGNCAGVVTATAYQTAASSSNDAGRRRKTLAIVLGTVLPLLALIIIMGFVVLYCQQRRRRTTRAQPSPVAMAVLEEVDLSPSWTSRSGPFRFGTGANDRTKTLSDPDIQKRLEGLVKSDLSVTESIERSNKSKEFEDFQSLLTCPICFRIFRNPVSLITAQPESNASCCLHNFCGSCIVKHLSSDGRCPYDRLTIKSVNDNRNLRDIVEIFLKKFPEHNPSKEEIAEMNAIYVPGQRVPVPGES